LKDLSEFLLETLKVEDPYFDLERKNPFIFSYNKEDYLLHLTNVHSWTQRPHMRRIQIKNTIKDYLKKYHRHYVFGIFGYEEKTDTVSAWNMKYIDTDFGSSKSLYTYEEYLTSANQEGISRHINKDDSDLSSIHFKSKYLPLYLKNFKTNVIEIEGDDYEFKSFDFYHDDKNYKKLENKIYKYESLNFISDNSSLNQSKWDREEFIITLELYFKLQKNQRNKSNFRKDQSLELEAFELLKKRSKTNKSVVRTINSLELRHSNYLAFDPEYKGKGLSNGGISAEKIFKEFLNNPQKLEIEFIKIKKKYDFEFNSEFDEWQRLEMRDYQDQDPEVKIKISTKGLDEEEIKNRQERASRLHIETLNILADYVRMLGFSPKDNNRTFDLFAYDSQTSHIFEVKSLTEKNFRTQVRHAIVQLDEYIFRHKTMKTNGFSKTVNKNIVFHANPYLFGNKKNVDFYINFIKKSNINILYVDRDEDNPKIKQI